MPAMRATRYGLIGHYSQPPNRRLLPPQTARALRAEKTAKKTVTCKRGAKKPGLNGAFRSKVTPVAATDSQPIRLLADPLAAELFAHIRRAALFPDVDQAQCFGDFGIPWMGGEARLAIDCGQIDGSFRIAPFLG